MAEAQTEHREEGCRGGAGALDGIRVLKLGGLGPGLFAAMILADHGADVLGIERPGNPFPAKPKVDVGQRNKRLLDLHMKTPQGLEIALGCIDRADVVIEGFSPGVAARPGSATIRATRPALGQHTDEILELLGRTDTAALRERG